MKSIVLYCAVCALLLGTVTAKALGEKDGQQVEQSTESPIADMALVDTKTGDMQAESVKPDAMNPSDKDKLMNDSQQHTIADFVIHPLIALKPHVPEGEGKQAATSSTTPSPWQLFGFNTGQGLGSQVSSLAGSVTGWLGNRIQLPGLVDTPVRESTTTSTTSTTPKPDVVVRVKQRASTKKPLISIRGDNERPNRKTKRPNKYNNWDDEDDEDFDDEEDEEEEEVSSNKKRRRYQNNNHDDEEEEDDDDDEENDVSNNDHGDDEEDNEVADNNDDEQDDDAEEEEEEEERPKPVKQNQRRRRPRPLNNRRRVNHNQSNNQRRRLNNNNSNTSRKQQQQHRKPYQESEEIEQDDDDEADEETEAEPESESESESERQQDFYYNKNPSSKRSQTEQNFIQRGQETLIKQIQQFTGGQTPAEVTQTMRKTKKSGNKKQRNQATLIIKRNGQAIYVAPELLQVTDALAGNSKPAGQYISVTSNQVKKTSHYPQPPLTTPYKRKGKPTQYITIPWSQLGISPPNDLTALTNGIQTQPLILNIPQSAIDSMQYPKPGKRKQVITPEAVPLLADASIMDIFKPPTIPPARTPSTTKPIIKLTAQQQGPVLIATKTGPTRIRPATIVEKAPADENTNEKGQSDEDLEDETSQQLIVIGDESGERQLTRNEYRKILEFFNQRTGRQLNEQQEQLIPVEVIAAEDNTTTEASEMDDKMEKEMENVTEMPVNDSLKQESGMEMEMENVTEIPIDSSLNQEGRMEMEMESVTETPAGNSLRKESGMEMEMENATEIPVDNSLKEESEMKMEMENVTEIPVDHSLKQESPVDDVTEYVVENATESPVNV